MAATFRSSPATNIHSVPIIELSVSVLSPAALPPPLYLPKYLLSLHPCQSPCQIINSLAPGRSECDFKNVIFHLVLLIGLFRFSYGDALRWMPEKLKDDKSTLVQVMAWCHQATSHCLSQGWLSSLSPCGITWPQWVNNIETGTKWLPFSRLHFQMHFFAWKCSYCDWTSTLVCS